jgi:hypothetical protein
MLKSNRLYLLLLAVPLALAGCFEYDQDMVINEDGSGTVSIHYNAPAQRELEEYEEPGEWRENVPELPITENDVVDSFGGIPLAVEGVSIKTVDGYPDVSYTVKFDDVEDLNGRGIFYFEDGKFAQTFSLRDGEGVKTFEHFIDFDWPLAETYYVYRLSQYDLIFQVELPGKIVESNGVTGDGNTVRWEYTLEDLLGKERTLTATYRVAEEVPAEAEEKETGKQIAWVLGILILCALAAAPVALLLTKRDKYLFMGPVLEALKKGSVFKIAVGALLLAKAVAIVLFALFLYFNFWKLAIDMAGLWRLGAFAYAVILGIIAYMMAHATALRAKSILGLPDGERVIIPVMSTLARLVGELVACVLLAVAILSGGQGVLLLVAPATRPATFIADAGDKLISAALAVVLGFIFLLITYVLAELADIHANAARVSDPRKGGAT